jgi:hypothetical protein
MDRKLLYFPALAVLTLMTLILFVVGNDDAYAQNQTTTAMGDKVVKQETGVSAPDPVPGHESHELVVVLAPREDGKVWSGTVTYTASAKVDVVVLHPYNATKAPDDGRGEPLVAPSPFPMMDNLAIALMTQHTDSPVFAGSLPFVGSALAFHTTTGQPFTVTYGVDAEAKSPTG